MSSVASNRISVLTSHLCASCPASSAAAAPRAPVRVVVTGAAGNIAYSLLFMVAQGKLLGDNQPIELRLLDIPAAANAVKGVAMELYDGAYPLLTKIVETSDYKTAFENVDIALLVGAKPRGPGMQRKDLLTANAQIFAGQGKALNQWASRNVKVCVVGNPANTNALIAASNAPDLPKSAFTAMTRLDQNRALSQISSRINCPVEKVKNITIWGNHSKTQFPDVNGGVIQDFPAKGHATPVRSAVNDDKWLDGEFLSTVQDRGAAIITARGKSSAASAASACVDHVRDWVNGTPKGEYVSMAVYSDGTHYGVPAGIVYSFPCVCSGGQWKIVDGLKLNAWQQGKLEATAKELLEEKKEAGL